MNELVETVVDQNHTKAPLAGERTNKLEAAPKAAESDQEAPKE